MYISSSVTDGELRSDYNVFYHGLGSGFRAGATYKTLGQWQALGYDTHSVVADPQLLPDYSIPSTSPANLRGVNMGGLIPSYDYRGGVRPLGAKWSIGAFECQMGPSRPKNLRRP